MATAPMSTDPSKLSFAKVAASAGKNNVALASFAKVAASGSLREPRKENVFMSASQKRSVEEHHVPVTMSPSNPPPDQILSSRDGNSSSQAEALATSQQHTSEVRLVEAVKALNVGGPKPSLVVNGSGTAITSNKAEVESLSEEVSVRADSGSDLGTKPPSLDGKSITSGTTFALDEKESLRPDDSASVKAAEDDDTFSGRGSIVAGSRIGSEAAARAYRAQLHEAIDRRATPTVQERQNQGVFTPQSGSSGQQATEDNKAKPLATVTDTPEAFNLFYRQTPDEKLLEALESPKDRIFLLRLEQDVIEFVKDSKEPFIDLPPCNSFCRMLTHKLADYYHMTHQVDAVAGAVRIFRTPFCRLPPPLATISNPPTSGNTPPPTLPAMKIMRRGGDGDTGLSPSKATSEAGSDSKEKPLSAKEKLSREEREAAYNKARERIFGKGDQSGEATPDTEDGNEMSRSSSVSTKDRSGQSKRGKTGKQRRDDSESFDVRSQYTPFFPQPQQPTWTPTPQYAPMNFNQFNGPMPNNYQNTMPPQFGMPPQQFGQHMVNNSNAPPYNMKQQFSQPNQPRFQPQSAPVPTYGSQTQVLNQVPQQWSQTPYQNPYSSRAPVAQVGPPASAPPSTIPYPFGQLPSTVNPADPKSQHPIPGSFNRHAFNPKTQSFVPGNTGPPIPQPMSHRGSPNHGSPHRGSPLLSYNTYSPPQQQFASGMGYNMARQGSNSSVPSYHASPHMGHRALIQGAPHPQGLPQGMPQGIPHGALPPHNTQQGMPSNGQIGSHLPNFGNPSTLPPKPPTGM